MRKLTAVVYRDPDFEWRWFVLYNRLTVAESWKGFRVMTDCRANFEIVTGLEAPAISDGKTESTQIYLAEARNFKRA